MKIRIKSGERMSNRQYHRAGKPTWWAYWRDEEGETHFVRLPKVRGDEYLDVTVDVPEGVGRIYYGVGPRDRGVREVMDL